MTVQTLLPIYQFAKVLGLNPLHIMGVWYDNGSGRQVNCGEAIMQYSWQAADGVSREELAQAIQEAEEQIATHLGYWPAPTWTSDERVEVDQPADAWYRSIRDVVYGINQFGVKASHGELISGGRKSKTLMTAGRPVAYTDNDGDGYKETAEVTVNAGTVTDTEEIAIYYPGLDADDEAEIRPLSSVSITAGVATIRFRREQAVLSSLYERLDAGVIDGSADANFLSTVDVYRRYHDPNVQAQLVWSGSQCSCSGLSSCGTCGLTIQNGCLTVQNRALGIVSTTPADWDSVANDFVSKPAAVCGRRPDYVRLWYRSGYKDMAIKRPNVEMSPKWQRAIAKLAISKLDREICGCKSVADVQGHWNSDLRKSKGTRGENITYKVTNYEMDNNPFGTTVAALEVWRLVRKESLGL